MRVLVHGWLLGTAALLSSAATAQAPSGNARPADIVVTGTRDLERQVRDFVSALTPAAPRGQIGRFEWEVCPVVVGLGATQKEAVERRMRLVAGGAGMRVAEADCAPNAIVIVTGDKNSFIDTLARKKISYFGDMSPAEIRRVGRQPGASAAWHLQGMVSAGGHPLSRDNASGLIENRTTRSPSRITAATRPVFEAGALVVESGALTGLSTTQLADYAAMRLFARTDPSRLGQPAPPTILAALDAPADAEVPLTLTEWELGFLRGLYASTDNLYAPAQRTEIRKGIVNELKRDE